jgi:hypothetical protein
MQNGIVGDIHAKQMGSFQMNDYKRDVTFKEEATRGIHASNKLNTLFFSAQNIAAIQHGIRYNVYTRSNKKHIIGNQSEQELKIVMRSVYLQNSKNLDYNILEQTRELNAMVLAFCVDQVLSELGMYSKYISDIETLPMTMSMPTNMSNKGTKSLELKKFM